MQKKWPEAESLLKEVVNSNEYSLMLDYANAFSNTSDNKNNRESVFEVQFMEGSAGYNGSIIYNFLPRPLTAAEQQPITGTSNPQDLSAKEIMHLLPILSQHMRLVIKEKMPRLPT